MLKYTAIKIATAYSAWVNFDTIKHCVKVAAMIPDTHERQSTLTATKNYLMAAVLFKIKIRVQYQ